MNGLMGYLGMEMGGLNYRGHQITLDNSSKLFSIICGSSLSKWFHFFSVEVNSFGNTLL